MDLTISGRHVEVTDAMREHARDRAEKLPRFSPHLMRVNVTLAIEGERHMADVVATVRAKGEVVGKAETQDMYASIDQAMVKVERQLHKMEERFKDRREGAKGRRGEGMVSEDSSGSDEADEEE